MSNPRGNTEPAFKSHDQLNKERVSQAIALNMSRQDMFNLGFLTVEDLDDEELRYGRCRNDVTKVIPKAGNKTEFVPRDQYEAMVQEHQRRTTEKLRQNLDDALATMIDVMKDQTAEPRDKFEAAKYLFERVAGKTPDKVQVSAAKEPWEDVFAGIAAIGRDQSRNQRTPQPINSDRPDQQEPIDAEVTEPPVQAQPYGYIQVPTDASVTGQPNQPTYGHPGQEQPVQAQDATCPSDQGPAPQTTSPSQPDYQRPNTSAPPVDLFGSATCPDPDQVHPQTHVTPPQQAPTFDRPATSMSQQSATLDSTGQPLMPEPDMAKPLSERLQERQAAADALRELRAERRNMRQQAVKARKVKRALGMDAAAPIDIRATFTPLPDQEDAAEPESNLKFTVD